MITYNKILVPVDGSEIAECVLPHIETLAAKQLAETIIFLRIVEETKIPSVGGSSAVPTETWMKMERENQEEAIDYLEDLKNRLDIKGVELKFVTLPPASASEMIAKYANDEDVDLIVMATHGRSGISKLVWGSVTDHVLKHVSKPIMIIRASGCE